MFGTSATAWKKCSGISIMRMEFYCFLVLGLFLLSVGVAAARENPFEKYERYSTIESTDVLRPNETNIYHIDMEPPKGLFANPNPPEFILYSFRIVGNGTFQVVFLREYTEYPGDFLEGYSSNGSVSKYSKTYWLTEDDGEDFTIIVLTEEDTNITYELFIGLFREKSKFWFFVGGGIGAGVAIISVVLVWLHVKSKKGKETESHEKETPKDKRPSKPSRGPDIAFGPSHPSVQRGWSFSPPRPKKGHRSLLVCPYCRKVTGTVGNRLLFKNIKFIVKESTKREKGLISPSVIKSRAAFCENCKSVLGIVKR